MLIYHGSTERVEHPEIRKSQRALDYGSGFYTPTSYEQAERWVRRKMQTNKANRGFVNIYEFNPLSMQAYKCLSFPTPTEEWVDFVMANRMTESFSHDYDIVYGPVANDRVYAAFSLYESRIINKRALIEELRAYKLVDQYLFHTERSLECITFIEAKTITL